MPLFILTESALLLSHVRVELLPAVIEVGSAESVTVGAGADSDTLSVTLSVEQLNKVKIMNSNVIFFTRYLKTIFCLLET